HCTNKPNCQNGGFVNFQCTCTCPDVLTGTTCEQTVSNSQTCGGVINLAAGEERLIQSPNYPSNYPTGLECTWVCGTNFVADVEKWDSSPDELSNAMIIRFDSNTYSSASVSKGFSIKVSTIGAGCLNNPCVFGTCSSPLNSGTYTCACNPGVTGTNCDQLTPSYQLICTFEFGEKCPFENEGSNAINWDTNSQGTPSSNTGPSNAHGGFQYVYTEMSGKNPGDKATMSTTSQLPTISRCMTFYYHMKGSTMGTLNIYSEGTNTAKYNIWTRSGAQGDDWIKAEIDIPAINGLKMTIEGVCGSDFSSDIAIDDLSLIPGTCGNPVTAAPTTASPTTASPTTTAPTTAAPTTAAPTTAAPVTAAPTTAAPTTASPTTAAPTTAAPTTAAPSTAAPTTVAPVTAAPTTTAPTTPSSTTAAPTNASTTAAPTTPSPTTAAPTTASPTTTAPTTPSPTMPSPTTAAPTTAATTTPSPTTSQPTDGTQTCTFEDGAPCFFG
ncbi:Hypothetical predicted protein, partial [Mytilus galloprovincialis]